MSNELKNLYQRPDELLQRLIRFDTSHPSGDTAACVAFIDELFGTAGIETRILARTPAKANLVARLPGSGYAPPLLMYGHLDVVGTANQNWRFPPFEGVIVEDCIWGRGALDMKGCVAMMLTALLRARAENLKPSGDVILAAVCDEEIGGKDGAGFLVTEHADLFEGVRYAIGEFGGFSLYQGNKKLYPIQVAEKQMCWLKATVQGRGGHGSMPVRGQAMAKLAGMLRKIDRRRLPVHVTPAARLMIDEIATTVGGVGERLLRRLTQPRWTDAVLTLLGKKGMFFDPLLHNTVTPTILHGSTDINVIPGEVSVELDGRLLPGYQPSDLVAELGHLLGPDVTLEVLKYIPGPGVNSDLGLFKTLRGILRSLDPDGTCVPYMIPGVTDAHHFFQLGIQTYGFTPMQLPQGFTFNEMIHGPDERIPVGAVGFGAEAITRLLQRIGK